MQKNIFKKITCPVEILRKISFGMTSILIAIFSFSLFVPFQQIWAAPRLTIESNTITPKEYLISANVYELVNKSVFFLSSPSTGVLFKPGNSCTTSGGGNPSSCFVKFSSTQTGTFQITAWTDYSGKLQSEKAVNIIIPKENISPECKPPKALDWLNRCIDCLNPNIIVKGYCEKKITTTDCESLNRVLNTTTNKCDCIGPKIVNDTGDCKDPVLITPETPKVNTDTTYTPLAPLPGLPEGKAFETSRNCTKDASGKETCTNPCPFGNYLNIMIKLIIGIAAVLAMVMIVMGGIQYMTSDLISSKEAGKEQITHAILGLLLALGAFIILNTINPKLLSACLDKLPQATITISPDQELTIKNRSGGGTCETITDTNLAGYPSTIEKSGFKKETSASEPFKKLSAQASAISRLESSGKSDKLSSMDVCADGKSFSFGLFQINAAAHRNEIDACKGAFTIPAGDPQSQGKGIESVTNKNGQTYVSKWSCKTVEPAYTNCKNYLLNPTNNIKFAEGSALYGKNKWEQWTTYKLTCTSKF
jgi:hypothetical protein